MKKKKTAQALTASLSALAVGGCENVALGFLTQDISLNDTNSSGYIQLLPPGKFRAKDGRPTEVPHWNIDSIIASALIKLIQSRPNRFIVDYEHNTIHSKETGAPAPIAGTASDFEWREGEGLFAKVEWTEKAKEMIANGEYLYVSPVILYDKNTGDILDLRMAAITNDPGIPGMKEITALAADLFINETQENTVNKALLAVLTALGLSENSTEEECNTAITALQADKDKNQDLETQVATLTANGAVDLSQYVPLKDFDALKTEMAALTSNVNTQEVEGVVEAALASGHLVPAQKTWALNLGQANLQSLKDYIKDTPAIAALTTTQTTTVELEDGKEAALSSEDLEMCEAMGVEAEDYAKHIADNS